MKVMGYNKNKEKKSLCLFPPTLFLKIHLIEEYSKKTRTAAKKVKKLLPA